MGLKPHLSKFWQCQEGGGRRGSQKCLKIRIQTFIFEQDAEEEEKSVLLKAIVCEGRNIWRAAVIEKLRQDICKAGNVKQIPKGDLKHFNGNSRARRANISMCKMVDKQKEKKKKCKRGKKERRKVQKAQKRAKGQKTKKQEGKKQMGQRWKEVKMFPCEEQTKREKCDSSS